jgi:hypothetical protein
MYGLQSDDMGVYRKDKNENPEYNYQYINVIYDYFIENALPLGFIITHRYGVKQGYLDESGKPGTVPIRNSISVSGNIQVLFRDFTNTYPGDFVSALLNFK